jgi:membrane-associated phospholipid phosphatase
MSRFLVLRRWERVAIAVAVAVFILLALDVANHGLVAEFDERVRDVVQPRRPATPLWTAFPGGLGELWVATPLFVIAGLVVSQLTWQWWPLVLAVGSFAVVELAILVLKVLIGREGPGAQAERIGYPGYFPSGHTATSAVCFGVVVYLLICARDPAARAETASRVALAGGMIVGAISAWRAVLGDFHWIADGLGGLLVAFVVLVVAFAACRRNFERRGVVKPAEDEIAHELE